MTELVQLKLNVKREPDEFCKPCGLYKSCKSPIMNGEGSEHPTWMFIGEAPGREEDEEGMPFLGPSGELLREAIEEAGIDIQQCRFSNVVRCRPPDNKLSYAPHAVDHCKPHILREIRATNPKVIVILGAPALQSLLGKTGVMKLHGEVIDSGTRKYVISMHPAYVLRNNNEATRKRFYHAIKVAQRLATRKKHKEKKRHHEFIRDKQMLYEYTDMLRKQKLLGTDIEGSTLSAFDCSISPYTKERRIPQIGCFGFAYSRDSAVLYPVHGRRGYEDIIKVKPGLVLEAAKDICEDETIKHVLHFGKYDFVYSAVLEDIWIGGYNGFYYADTGLMLYADNERRNVPRGLKDISYQVGMPGYDQAKRQYCMENPHHDPDRGGNLIEMPAKLLYGYNLDDCIATFRVYHKYRERLDRQNLWRRPLLFPLMWHMWTAAIMEINGLKIDKKRNVEIEELYTQRIGKLDKTLVEFPEIKRLRREHEDKILEKIYERVMAYKKRPPNVRKKVLEFFEKADKTFNLNAVEQRRKLVYGLLGHKPVWYTKKSKQPSVEKDALIIVNKQRPTRVLTQMIRRAELASSKSKYVDTIPGWIGSDGRTHTTYRPEGIVTGRVSSEKPNHENFPKRYQLAMELRTQFVSSDGDHVLVELDKKQIELRLISDRAKDKVMIGEFKAGKDPHRMGAAAAYEIAEAEVTKEQRDDCKAAVSFGLVYGRTAAALAADFGWKVSRAEKFKARYFGKYHGIAAYLIDREEYILKKGVVWSYFHRRRHCDGFDSDDEGTWRAAVREGINSPIQGDASDITWVAGHRLARWLRKHNMKSKVIIAVHDALYIDVYKPELADVVHAANYFLEDRDFIEKMTGWYCPVPLPNDAFIGLSLGKMKELTRKENFGEFIIPKKLDELLAA